MMTEKPKALRLADVLDRSVLAACHDAAAELRRLHAENETLRADKGRLDWLQQMSDGGREPNIPENAERSIRGALDAAMKEQA